MPLSGVRSLAELRTNFAYIALKTAKLVGGATVATSNAANLVNNGQLPTTRESSVGS